MKLVLKYIYLYWLYLKTKFKYRKMVRFNGYAILYVHKGSDIRIDTRGDICINSSPCSNLVGLYQRTIISCRGGGVIKIGKGVGISGSTIYAINNIELGEYTQVGGNCKIIDNDFHPLDPDKRKYNRLEDIKSAPIIIGKNCFIGMNSIILKGTILGDNCVVGAGSVVHGEFPANCIIAGNPAKIIKRLSINNKVG